MAQPSLLDALRQYLRDAAPGGALNPEVTGQGILDAGAMVTAPVPGVGDVVGLLADANRMRDPNERTPMGMALMALGALPLVPSGLGAARKALSKTDDAKRAKTSFEIAHEVAQRNAALPVSQGGLGLPPNNTAMDRARAMGFYDGWKHGSPDPGITAFDPSRAGKRGVDFGPATFATKHGDNASGYALNWSEYRNHPIKNEIEAKRQDILNQFLKARDAGDIEGAAKIRAKLNELKDGQELYDDFLNYKIPSTGSTVYPLMVRADDMPWVDGAGQNFGKVHKEAIDIARSRGSPGVRINNVADNSGRYNGASDVIAVFDPSHMRSRFAAFDPMKRDSSDILASLAPYLITGGLAGLLGLSSDNANAGQ